jgi:DNA-binding NarL/FixJ family response regulator
VVTEAALRVVVADDYLRIRRRIVAALEEGGCVVLGEAGTADGAVALVLEHRPDVAVLDVHMPGGGIHAAEMVTRHAPEVRVVMLTQSPDEDDVFDAIRAGAAGYVLKNADLSQLAEALRGVVAGRATVSPILVTRLLDEFRAPTRRRAHRGSAAASRLTSREWEIMELLGQGLSTEEVATRLYLSATTVRVHVSSVVRKLRVRDRDAALALLRSSH